MNVTAAEIYLSSSSTRQTAIVRLQTDAGLTGVGEAGMHFASAGLAHVIKEMLWRYILGEDPRDVERLWARMYRESDWARGGGVVLLAAISAIDEALWDIAGQALGVPVYALLGGKVRSRIRLYANGWHRPGDPPAEYAHAAEQVAREGYTALALDPFQHAAAEHNDQPQRHWERRDIQLAVQRVAAVRRAVGPEVDLILVGRGRFDVSTAIEVGERLAEHDCLCFEEPTDMTNPEALAEVAASVPMAVAAGEKLYTRWGFLPFLSQHAVRIVQPDVGNSGGISECRKIATLAETFHRSVALHNCWGPVATAATIQVAAATTNLLMQEWFPDNSDDHYRMVEDAYKARDGAFILPEDRPGLGVRLNKAFMESYLIETVAI